MARWRHVREHGHPGSLDSAVEALSSWITEAGGPLGRTVRRCSASSSKSRVAGEQAGFNDDPFPLPFLPPNKLKVSGGAAANSRAVRTWTNLIIACLNLLYAARSRTLFPLGPLLLRKLVFINNW